MNTAPLITTIANFLLSIVSKIPRACGQPTGKCACACIAGRVCSTPLTARMLNEYG